MSCASAHVCGLVPTETSALPHRMRMFGRRPPSGWRSGQDQFGRWAGHPVLERCRPLLPGLSPNGRSVWHHVEDGQMMRLIPHDIHQAVRHIGRSAVIRESGGG